MKRAGAGFTLIETLVALAILALFALFAWRATAALTDGEARLADEAARWHALDAGCARLEADMRAAIPRPVRTPAGREAAWLASVDRDGNAELAFTRASLDASDPLAPGVRVGYRLRDRTLELVYWAGLDRLDDAPVAVHALVGGIASLAFRYADAAGNWFERWPPPGRDDLPRAAIVRLALAEGGELERWVVFR